MVWTPSFKPYLLHHLKICTLLRCSFVEWDYKSGQLTLPKNCSKWRVFSQALQILCSLVYGVVIIMQLAFGENTILEKLQGIPFFGVLVIMIISRWYWPSPSGLNKPGQAINMFVRFKNSSSRKTGKFETVSVKYAS